MIDQEKLLQYLFGKANEFEFKAERLRAPLCIDIFNMGWAINKEQRRISYKSFAFALRKVAYKIENGEFETRGENDD